MLGESTYTCSKNVFVGKCVVVVQLLSVILNDYTVQP